MSEVTAPEAELENPTLTVINDESPPVDDAAPADPELEAPASPSSPSEEPAPPAPPEARTWQNVVEDYQAWMQGDKSRALTPDEFGQVQQAITNDRNARNAAAERQRKIAQAFPDTVSGIVADTAALFGISEGTPEYIALQKKVEDRVMHGDESLHSVASQSVLGPVYDAQSGWLFEKLGRSQEAANYIQRLDAAAMLQAAHDIGARNAANSKVEVMDDAKIEQHAKGELKAPGKMIPFEASEKAVARAVAILRDAAKPGTYPPAPGQPGSQSTQTLTYERMLTMSPDQIKAIPSDVYLKVLEEAK